MDQKSVDLNHEALHEKIPFNIFTLGCDQRCIDFFMIKFFAILVSSRKTKHSEILTETMSLL